MTARSTEDFRARHPVFSLDELAAATGAGRAAARERVRHHARRGRLRRLAKGLYAAVPRGERAERFVPDRYRVAAVEAVLEAYAQNALWACVGGFLERYRQRFFVPEARLTRLEARRPRAAHYVPRRYRGGLFVPRWNRVLPEALVRSDAAA